MTKGRINLGRIATLRIKDGDELEDYLEMHDPKVNVQIRQSNLDVRAGRTTSPEALLADLTARSHRSSRRRHK